MSEQYIFKMEDLRRVPLATALGRQCDGRNTGGSEPPPVALGVEFDLFHRLSGDGSIISAARVVFTRVHEGTTRKPQ